GDRASRSQNSVLRTGELAWFVHDDRLARTRPQVCFPDDRLALHQECEVVKACLTAGNRFPAPLLDRRTVVTLARRRVHSRAVLPGMVASHSRSPRTD